MIHDYIPKYLRHIKNLYYYLYLYLTYIHTLTKLLAVRRGVAPDVTLPLICLIRVLLLHPPQ